MARDEFDEPFQDVLDDHEGLLSRVTELERAQDPARVGALVSDLVPLLERHFEREERAGGMFEHVENQDPRHAGEIRELRADHSELLEQAGVLLQRAGDAGAGRHSTHDLIAEVRSFATHIRRHEARENALLADSLYHEEGGGD